MTGEEKNMLIELPLALSPLLRMFHVDVLNFSTEHVAYMPISYYVPPWACFCCPDCIYLDS